MLLAITARWKTIPPVSVSAAQIAAALGVKRAEPVSRQEMFDGLSAIGVSSGGIPEWLKAARAAEAANS